MYDQEKKKSRGFGFLSFADESACSKAVAEHFVNIQSKQVYDISFKNLLIRNEENLIDVKTHLFMPKNLCLG